ncbi:MAG TPA: hypothetical protein DIU08_14730, partial [Ktedonobacter sp.]|nr:hypothetical protein [Ktedonobacter sp.]
MYSQPQQAPSNPVPNTYYPQQQGYQATPGPAPAYAKPVKDSSKSVLGQMGCGVLLLILLIVGICGGVGFFVYRYAISAANSTTSSYTSTTNGTGGNGTPQAIPTTTTQINSTVTYDSSDVTVVNVQKASSFSDDDTTSSSPYVVRLNIKEHNPTTNDV